MWGALAVRERAASTAGHLCRRARLAARGDGAAAGRRGREPARHVRRGPVPTICRLGVGGVGELGPNQARFRANVDASAVAGLPDRPTLSDMYPVDLAPQPPAPQPPVPRNTARIVSLVVFFAV